jgi:hypothetical protein
LKVSLTPFILQSKHRSKFLFNKRGTYESVNAATISKRYRHNWPISKKPKILIDGSEDIRKSFFYHYHPP